MLFLLLERQGSPGDRIDPDLITECITRVARPQQQQQQLLPPTIGSRVNKILLTSLATNYSQSLVEEDNTTPGSIEDTTTTTTTTTMECKELWRVGIGRLNNTSAITGLPTVFDPLLIFYRRNIPFPLTSVVVVVAANSCAQLWR